MQVSALSTHQGIHDSKAPFAFSQCGPTPPPMHPPSAFGSPQLCLSFLFSMWVDGEFLEKGELGFSGPLNYPDISNNESIKMFLSHRSTNRAIKTCKDKIR